MNIVKDYGYLIVPNRESSFKFIETFQVTENSFTTLEMWQEQLATIY